MQRQRVRMCTDVTQGALGLLHPGPFSRHGSGHTAARPIQLRAHLRARWASPPMDTPPIVSRLLRLRRFAAPPPSRVLLRAPLGFSARGASPHRRAVRIHLGAPQASPPAAGYPIRRVPGYSSGLRLGFPARGLRRRRCAGLPDTGHGTVALRIATYAQEPSPLACANTSQARRHTAAARHRTLSATSSRPPCEFGSPPLFRTPEQLASLANLCTCS